MRVLIVEDDASMQIMEAEYIERWLIERGETAIIIMVSNLRSALEQIPAIDAVLCDGTFPTGEPVPEEPAETELKQSGNWMTVWYACKNKGKRFVLFSGNSPVVSCARKVGIAAFEKPFGLQPALAVLLGHKQGPGENPHAVEVGAELQFCAQSQGSAPTIDNPAVLEVDAANREITDEEGKHAKRKYAG